MGKRKRKRERAREERERWGKQGDVFQNTMTTGKGQKYEREKEAQDKRVGWETEEGVSDATYNHSF